MDTVNGDYREIKPSIWYYLVREELLIGTGILYTFPEKEHFIQDIMGRKMSFQVEEKGSKQHYDHNRLEGLSIG